jgi:hypothetical protein
LLRSPVGDRQDTVNKSVAALKEGREAIPAERYARPYRTAEGMARTTAVHLHAERRIKKMLTSWGRTMNLDVLAAPCAPAVFVQPICNFEALRPRGPLWLSRNATFELDVDAIIDEYLGSRLVLMSLQHDATRSRLTTTRTPIRTPPQHRPPDDRQSVSQSGRGSLAVVRCVQRVVLVSDTRLKPPFLPH